MPYVFSKNSSGDRTMIRTNTSTTFEAHGYTGLDLVYSHRTGSKAEGAKPSPEEVYSPPGGNVVEDLVYRRKFIERRIGAILTENLHKSRPAQYILGDMGHEFAVSHARFVGGPCFYRRFSGSAWHTFSNPVPRFWLATSDSGLTDSTVSPIGDPLGFFSSRAAYGNLSSAHRGLTEDQANSLATNAIQQVSPFKAVGGIFATLAELARGDIPGILTDLRRHFDAINMMKASGIKSASQALGSEYLNNVFGWTPIIKDVQAAITVLTAIDSLLFPEDSTRRTHRSTIRSISFNKTGDPSLGNWPPLAAGTAGSAETVDFSRTHTGLGFGNWIGQADLGISQTESLWVSARFATGMTPSTTNNSHLDRAIDLLGLKITPSLIWELTPWSWLIDWFLNIGTVIENLSNLGLSNTILNYAYATYRRESLHTVSVDPAQLITERVGNQYTGSRQFMLKVDQKVRIAASPFGFGIAGSSLGANQLAILTALGLARLR